MGDVTDKITIATITNPDGQVWENCISAEHNHSDGAKVRVKNRAWRRCWDSIVGTRWDIKPPYGFKDNLREAGFTCVVSQIEVLP